MPYAEEPVLPGASPVQPRLEPDVVNGHRSWARRGARPEYVRRPEHRGHPLADTPRAHITNQRTMEVLRDLGVEDEVVAKATPQRLMGDTTFCTSLAGTGWVRSWGQRPARPAGDELASPTRMCDMPSTSWSPCSSTRRGCGTGPRFSTVYKSFVQDDEGVTVTVEDRRPRPTSTPSAPSTSSDPRRALPGRRGRRTADGQMGVACSINIVFEMTRPSTPRTARPTPGAWAPAPPSAGIGAGLVAAYGPGASG